MHQEVKKSRHQQGLCVRCSASKNRNAHALWAYFAKAHGEIICANERKRSSQRTCFN